jgi:glucose-6-phosphate dehydrogenase assembly protein OpcA
MAAARSPLARSECIEDDVTMARRPAKKKVRKPRSPGDYEAELVRLCKGNKREAERLILQEQTRQPSMSRQGAALALVTRIRHERAPYSRRL